MAATDEEVLAPANIEIIKWKVKKGTMVFKGSVLALYVDEGAENKNETKKLKADHSGMVSQIMVGENTTAHKNDVLLVIQPQTEKVCTHPTIMKDMCADCGADLRSENGLAGDRIKSVSASVAMVHSIPELIISQEQALEIGKEDENRLLRQKKLVLLVDLDQTLIHTTNDNIPANLKGVKHFQLFYGKDYMWYHTRFRPFTHQFLASVSKMFELHICTFGVRLYAHTIARLLDPEEKYFSHRILSRDECFDALSKTANLKALFPCGDKMVSIIDDREDVWNYAPNLIHVKPYRFFQGTADINAPPGLSKSEHDSEPLVHKIVEHTDEAAPGSEGTADATKCGEDPASGADSKDNESGENAAKDAAQASSNSSAIPVEDTAADDGTEVINESIQSDIDTNKLGQPPSGKTADEAQHEAEGDAEMKNVEPTTDIVNSKMDNSGDKSSAVDEKYDRDKVSQAIAAGEEGAAWKEEDLEWDDEDDYLLYLEEILTRIHKAYYDMYEQSQSKGVTELPDLKNIIPYVRKKVLKGANIVFSGMFPLNMPAEQSRAYIVARALGANIQNEIVPRKSNTGEATTHLVATKPGTGKHKIALKTKGIHIVSGDWLWSCNERWMWVDERLFPLASKDVKGVPSPEESAGLKRNSNKRKNLEDAPSDQATEDDLVFNESLNGACGKKRKTNDVEQQIEINMEPGTSSVNNSREGGQPQDSFATSYNPLYSLSDEDIELMDKEVDELMDEDEYSSEESDSEREERMRKKVLGKSRETDSDSDSLSGDLPRGWKLHRKSCSPKQDGRKEEEGDGLKSDAEDDEETENELERYQKNIEAFVEKESSSDSSENDQSIGSVDDEIADAVEKEFLGT